MVHFFGMDILQKWCKTTTKKDKKMKEYQIEQPIITYPICFSRSKELYWDSIKEIPLVTHRMVDIIMEINGVEEVTVESHLKTHIWVDKTVPPEIIAPKIHRIMILFRQF